MTKDVYDILTSTAEDPKIIKKEIFEFIFNYKLSTNQRIDIWLESF